MRKIPAEELLRFALDEDRASRDITTPFFYSDADKLNCDVIAKSSGIFCGAEFITAIWSALSATIKTDTIVADGTSIQPNDLIARFSGSARAVLGGERTLLNIIQRLSGIATQTHRFVEALGNPEIQLLDTRKTTPLWRDFEKHAVRVGGGYSHRRDLSDMVLIKENHLAGLKAAGNWAALPDILHRIRSAHPNTKIEIEIESPDMLNSIDLSSADIIMLDNFALKDIAPSVELIRSKGYKAAVEVSGGVTLQNISQYRNLPIQRISVGALTHSVPALDISLLMTPEMSRKND